MKTGDQGPEGINSLSDDLVEGKEIGCEVVHAIFRHLPNVDDPALRRPDVAVTTAAANFMSILVQLGERFGAEDAWGKLEEFVSSGGFAFSVADLAEFSSSKLLFAPVFVGPHQNGQWSLLVCDRRFSPGLFVHFDVFPDYTERFLSRKRFQEVLRETPLWREGARFVSASMPIEATGSNDCGVWTCLIAAIYLKRLRSINRQFSAFSVKLAANATPETAGVQARSFLLESIRNHSSLVSYDVLSNVSISFE